jgi:hypothetical protein
MCKCLFLFLFFFPAAGYALRPSLGRKERQPGERLTGERFPYTEGSRGAHPPRGLVSCGSLGAQERLTIPGKIQIYLKIAKNHKI